MATVAGRECKLLSSRTELEEEHEDEIVGRNIIGAADHLKCHHLVHVVCSKHLGTIIVLLEKLILEVSNRKAEPDVKGL